MQQELKSILTDYQQAKTQPFTGHPIRNAFKRVKDELVTAPPVRSRPKLKIQPSIGNGKWADVPWIAFLDERGAKSVREGVDCVLLFRRDMTGVYLTLNQGVEGPKGRLGKRLAYEELRNRAQSIRSASQQLRTAGFSLDDTIDLRVDKGRGADYQVSTIAHKLYEAERIPDDAAILEDLEAVLKAYDRYLDRPAEGPMIAERNELGERHPLLHDFHLDATAIGLRVSRDTVLRLIASLLSKRFLILTGLAGSGKTRIAQAFARWITPHESPANPYYLVIPVGADWTGNDNILGYPNGLNPASYVRTPALDLILHAIENETVPHFLILDEMNLSHVERYFADLLSALESGEEIPLYEADVRDGNKSLRDEVPDRLKLPNNLFIIGTVNVDETTYMFSPKVLDRAFAEPFLSMASQTNLSVPNGVQKKYSTEMLLLFELLHTHDAEFGYRVAFEAARFLHFYKSLGGYGDGDDWFNRAIDAVVVQKMLPKLHGSRSKLEGLLWALAWACGLERTEREGIDFTRQLANAGEALDEVSYGPEKVAAILTTENSERGALYPLSHDKVMRMWRRLVRDQFVTFAEA